MAVTLESFRATFPMFDCIDDPAVSLALQEAECEISKCAWGKKADLGLQYYAAHILETTYKSFAGCAPCGDAEACGSNGCASPGLVKRLTLEEWSEFYHIPLIYDTTTFGSTAWGRRYFDMRRTVFACRTLPFPSVGCAPCGPCGTTTPPTPKKCC